MDGWASKPFEQNSKKHKHIMLYLGRTFYNNFFTVALCLIGNYLSMLTALQVALWNKVNFVALFREYASYSEMIFFKLFSKACILCR